MVKYIPGMDEAQGSPPSSVISVLNGSCLWNKWTFMFLWNKKYWEAKEALWLCGSPRHIPGRHSLPRHCSLCQPFQVHQHQSWRDKHSSQDISELTLPTSTLWYAGSLDESRIKEREALFISSSGNGICEEAYCTTGAETQAPTQESRSCGLK